MPVAAASASTSCLSFSVCRCNASRSPVTSLGSSEYLGPCSCTNVTSKSADDSFVSANARLSARREASDPSNPTINLVYTTHLPSRFILRFQGGFRHHLRSTGYELRF